MTPIQACEQALDQAIAKAEALIEKNDQIEYWLDRYNPVDWSPLLIAAMVVWAGLG